MPSCLGQRLTASPVTAPFQEAPLKTGVLSVWLWGKQQSPRSLVRSDLSSVVRAPSSSPQGPRVCKPPGRAREGRRGWGQVPSTSFPSWFLLCGSRSWCRYSAPCKCLHPDDAFRNHVCVLTGPRLRWTGLRFCHLALVIPTLPGRPWWCVGAPEIHISADTVFYMSHSPNRAEMGASVFWLW